MFKLGFMRKFGYLNSSSTASTSETLYHEDDFVAAVKNMQRYGALNQTGVLDNATIKVRKWYLQVYDWWFFWWVIFSQLLTAPRCGVPDIPKRSLSFRGKRRKRFVLGSQGWQKRRITYLWAIHFSHFSWSLVFKIRLRDFFSLNSKQHFKLVTTSR